MDSNIENLIAELKWEVPESDLARLTDIYEKVIGTLTLGFDPSVLVVLDNEDAHQTEIERIKFILRENIVARLMARANSVVMFGKIKSGDASSFTKVVLRMGMKTAKIYILALAHFSARSRPGTSGREKFFPGHSRPHPGGGTGVQKHGRGTGGDGVAAPRDRTDSCHSL